MWGADDPDDRKPMIWEDLTYENERSHPVPGKTRTDDEVKFDKSLYDYYKMLVRIRKENVALRRGDFTSVLIDDTKNVYVFKRTSGENEVIVVLNNDDGAQTVDVTIAGSWRYRDALTGTVLEGKERLRCQLGPKSGTILVNLK
jgi:glycosidase